MKKKVFTMIALFSMILGMCLGVVNNVYASGDMIPYANEDGSGTTGSAVISGGKKNYSSNSKTSVTFTIRSRTTTTEYLLINMSATNGTIKDNITGKLWINPGTGKTSSTIIRKNGVTFIGRFTPYNSNANGYDITSYAAYNS